MVRVVVFLSIAILLFSATPLHRHTTIAAQTDAAVRTSRIISHGLELSLSLPRRAYPQNAIVRVRVTVRNVSHHVIRIGTSSGPECPWSGPGAEVLDANGKLLYPPGERTSSTCGPYILPRPLPPGRSLHHTTFVILRGALLRGVVRAGSVGMLRTPPLHLTLTDEAAPILSVHITPTLHLTISPSNTAQSGAFYYLYDIMCLAPPGGSGGGIATGTLRWRHGIVTRDGSFLAAADCDLPSEWLFTGGWVDHPAVSLDYRPPGRNTL